MHHNHIWAVEFCPWIGKTVVKFQVVCVNPKHSIHAISNHKERSICEMPRLLGLFLSIVDLIQSSTRYRNFAWRVVCYRRKDLRHQWRPCEHRLNTISTWPQNTCQSQSAFRKHSLTLICINCLKIIFPIFCCCPCNYILLSYPISQLILLNDYWCGSAWGQAIIERMIVN